MKSAQDYLAEANAIVPKIETQVGIEKHGQSGVVFVDVRDSAAMKAEQLLVLCAYRVVL